MEEEEKTEELAKEVRTDEVVVNDKKSLNKAKAIAWLKKDRTVKMILSALFAALIAVGAFIKIPVPVVPFTMQMCFVNMAGLMLGGFYGGLSVVIYVLLGLIGIPIFAHGGGIMYVLNPTFGYLFGMIVAAYGCGYISHIGGKVSWLKMILGTLFTFFAVYLFGLSHAALIGAFYLHNPIPASTLFLSYFAMFLPGDITTCAITVVVSMKLLPILERMGYQVASNYDLKKMKQLAKSSDEDVANNVAEDTVASDEANN